jgi:hypothetical protein
MFMANSKQVKGLRTTGIGGVTCSRHNMWRANSMGDLQVGERCGIFYIFEGRTPTNFNRYCNIDFLLLSTVIAFQLLWLIV